MWVIYLYIYIYIYIYIYWNKMMWWMLQILTSKIRTILVIGITKTSWLTHYLVKRERKTVYFYLRSFYILRDSRTLFGVFTFSIPPQLKARGIVFRLSTHQNFVTMITCELLKGFQTNWAHCKQWEEARGKNTNV